MKIYKVLFLSLFVSFVSYEALANVRTNKMIQDDIKQLKSDMQIVQRSLYRSADLSKENSGDVLIKLGEIENSFAMVTGKVEEFEHRLKNLEEKIEIINKDVELRFTMLDEKISVNNLDHQKPAPTKVDKAKKVAISGTVEEMYKQGLDSINNHQNDRAIEIFLKILKENPKHQLSVNAEYWLGEAYYAKKEFKDSAVVFARCYTQYKESSKSGDCLLKLGMTMIELDKKVDGCAAFLNLPKEVPNASQSLKDKALFQIKKNSCN